MFDEIAPLYDFLNHVLSFNLDRRWRRKLVEWAQLQAGDRVLDLCGGTGDLALEFARCHPELREILGVDFSEAMVEIARRKAAEYKGRNGTDRCNTVEIKWLCADVGDMDESQAPYDCVSCAFGLRNLKQPQVLFEKAFKLLKPGGRLMILEFALPQNVILEALYQCYFRIILPLVGTVIAQDRCHAYHYLPRSVRQFQTARLLNDYLPQAGFADKEFLSFCGGTVLACKAYKNQKVKAQSRMQNEVQINNLSSKKPVVRCSLGLVLDVFGKCEP